jgi:hypothetical protein
VDAGSIDERGGLMRGMDPGSIDERGGSMREGMQGALVIDRSIQGDRSGCREHQEWEHRRERGASMREGWIQGALRRGVDAGSIDEGGVDAGCLDERQVDPGSIDEGGVVASMREGWIQGALMREG